MDEGSVARQPRAAAMCEAQRLASLDLLRGIVVVLMAIDHVRVYSGLPAGGVTAGIFLTRWVTHFCAPLFVFLAGAGAFLNGERHGLGTLARYLLTRGAMLVVLELTVIRWLWSFHWDPTAFTLAGVIWMLGWCMILLTAMLRFSARTVGIIGIAVVVLQPLFAWPGQLLPTWLGARWIWEFIYPAGLATPEALHVLYVIVPWVGVMMMGYGVGTLLTGDPGRRHSVLLRAGLAMTAAFLAIGIAGAWASPRADMPFALQVLDQRKYPASVPFLLMTLGPAIALLPLLEQVRGRFARAMITFGRVPMFYYVLHIPLIHLSALAVQRLRDGAMHPEFFTTAPYTWMPEESRWSLGLLYLVVAVDIVLLYAACQWFVRVKARRTEGWLRYL